MAASVVDQAAGSSLGRASALGPVRYGRARQALVDATVVLSARVGFHDVTVAELSVAAGVGPRTFYNHFADLSDVLFEACWQIHEELRAVIQAAHEGAVNAPDDEIAATHGDCLARRRAEACVEALIGFVRADPGRARVVFVQGYAGGPAVAGLRAETVGWLIGLLVGEGGSRGPRDVRRLSAEFAVGGVNGVLCSRIKADDLDGLEDLVPSFVETLLGVGGGGDELA